MRKIREKFKYPTFSGKRGENVHKWVNQLFYAG